MSKITFRHIGVVTLIIYMLESLFSVVDTLGLFHRNYNSVLFLVISVLIAILAEVWAVGYWRSSRTRLSTVALAVVTVIVISNIYLILPVFNVALHQI